ncbi:MAG: hypothetical protein IKG37_05370, partial [Solobacterium sp.]|nr:hypothetical protein [Solobacterium sp.]
FTGTGYISIDDTCTMYSPFSSGSLTPGVWFLHDATPGTISDTVSCELNTDRTVATFTIRKTISDDQYSNLYKIRSTKKNIVTGSTIGTVEVNSAGKIKGIPGFRRLIPELEHWQYAGFDEGTWQNKTIELTAWYRPILDAIEVQVDHAAAAKTSLPRVKKIILKSGSQSWTIDAPKTGKVTHQYRKKGDQTWTENIGNADPDTSYNAKYSLNLVNCEATTETDQIILNDNFALSDNCSLILKDSNNKEVSLQESILQVPPESDTGKYLIIEGTYHTGRLSIVSVSPFGPVFFAHGTSSDEVKEYLENARGLVKLSDGSRGNVSFKAPDSIVIPSGMEEQQISITAELISSAYDIPDNLKQLEIPVIIGQAPSAPVPILNPESTRFGEEGDIEIRHAHPDASGAEIKYAIIERKVVFDESGKDITPVPDISEFGTYNQYSEKLHFGAESLGKRIFLAVYASEEGFYDSIKDLYTYEVMTNYTNLSYVDADGNTQESVTAHRIREDMTELKSEGDQPAWFANSGDIILNERLEINGTVNLILSKGSTLT